jgi:hypothetical protein
MAKEIDPLDVAFVEKDLDLGGYFVYMDADLRMRDTEPVGHIVNAKVYNKLVATYGIPTVDEFANGRRKNIDKIKDTLSRLTPPLPKAPNVKPPEPPQTPEQIKVSSGLISVPLMTRKPVIRVMPPEEVPLIHEHILPPVDVGAVINNVMNIETKVCPCGNIMDRKDYPKLHDSDWNSKKYCTKACRKYRSK